MTIEKNIEKVNTLTKELTNHPCCFSYSWDEFKRLAIIFPEGYFYGVAQGIRFNEKTKAECLKKAIIKLDEVWKLNYV